ncbi:MAG: molybdopterin-dependent oxidoreductase, partial [Terriglobia bacterium]
FFIGHVTMVVLHGFARELAKIVLGQTVNPNLTLALALGWLGIAVVIAVHILGTEYSLHRPRMVQRRTQALIDPVRMFFFGHDISAQRYSRSAISPYFRANGRPPNDPAYQAMARNNFADYALDIGGLVENPLRLKLADLRAMPKTSQITKHCCIQGWSAIAEWGGVPMSHIIEICRPVPSALYVLFYGMDDKSKSEPDPAAAGFFYGSIHIEYARNYQTILAYEMNGKPLPIEHGAPLRLRVESQLGFTMVKYLRRIEFIDDYRKIGAGQGGWREDHQFYSPEAGI